MKFTLKTILKNFLKDLTFPECEKYFLNDINPYWFDLAANLMYARKLADLGVVRRETVERASMTLSSLNATKAQKLENLYLIGYEFGSYVLTNYWVLKPALEKKIADFAKAKFDSNFVIGIQLRHNHLNPEDIPVFIQCAEEIEVQARQKQKSRTFKWFISTENSQLVKKYFQNYTQKIISADGPIGHVENDSKFYERAIMDIELLGRCDVTILTGGSSFGFLGQMKYQKIPYYVEGKRKMPECQIFNFYAPSRTFYNATVF